MVSKTLLCCVDVVFGFVFDEFAMYLFLSNACYNQTPGESFHWISIKFNSQLMEDYNTHYSNDDDDDDEIDWMNG